MLPFVFNAEDEKDEHEEDNYDANNHQKGIEEFYKQYEQKQVNSRFYRDTVGISSSSRPDSIDAMQQRLAETQQAIQRINNDEKQTQQLGFFNPSLLPPGYFPNQPPPVVVVPEKSRSPSWAREARRSRSRSRERDRDRDRKHNKSRSRSRDRHRRSRSRDHDRRRRRDHRSRTRSRSPSSKYSRRRRSRSASREWVRDKYQDDWSPGIPCSKLALLNLPNDVDNAKITFALGKSGYLPQDVRTMTKYDKLSKQVRTFAFVEFCDTSTAEKWMEEHQGWLYLEDGRKVVAEYAKGDPQLGQANKGDDWICAHCSMNNFVKRQNCFKCEISKDQSMELERQGVHMVGIVPCDTLLIRGLPDKCETTTIFDSLATLICLTSISMTKLSDSKRFAYIQMKSKDEATMLLNLTYKSPLKIRNKDVQVSYCRDSMTKLIHQQMSMLTQGAQVTAPVQGGNMTGAEIAAAAISKAHAVRQASHQVGQMMTIPAQQQAGPAQQMQYHHHPSHVHHPIVTQLPPNFSIPPPTISTVAATVPAVQQAEQSRNGIVGLTATPRGMLPKYVTPNPSTFMPDANSGYYLDPITSFFYDSTTGYYYNNEAKMWCTWDPTYETYFAVEAENNEGQKDQKYQKEEETAGKMEEIEEEGAKKKKIKKNEESAGPKAPVDVAKDMLKWAKKQEKDKKKVQMSLKMTPKTATVEVKNVFHAEKRKISNPLLENDDDDTAQLDIDPHTGKPRRYPQNNLGGSSEGYEESSSSSKQQSTRKGGPSAIELREAMERALVDESKKMCLLCKRAFPSVDVLRKHVDKSDLHRTNLEQKRAEWGREYSENGGADDETEEDEGAEPEIPKMVYRDRAKERRKQFGIDPSGYAGGSGSGRGGGARNEEAAAAVRRESEEASKRPLDEKNIGNRLLKSMGWKEGQGVGKHGQGITAPIEAERFVNGAGLGSSGSKIRGGVEASHKEKTRQALYSRYNDA